MNSILQMLQFYNFRLSDQFIKLTNPLKECYQLDVLFYTRVTQQGFLFQVSNQAELAHFYWSSELFKTNPWIRDPSFYESGPMIVTDYPAKDFNASQQQMKGFYNSDHVFGYFQKDAEGVHWVGFGTTDDRLPVANLFFKESAILEKFGEYLLKEWQPYLPSMERFNLNISSILGPTFYKKPLQSNLNIEAKIKLLKTLQLIEGKLPSLSQRNLECLALLSRGKSATEIGHILQLSPRTVEFYTENLKNKLSCLTKRELIEKALEFQHYGLIDL